jgi:histidyl-tRNA synthetase
MERGDYVVKVNNRKILDGIREKIGVTNERQWLTVLRAIDKLDRLGADGVRALLGSGRKDESGDFTKGAELSTKHIDLISNFLFAETHLRGFEISTNSDNLALEDELVTKKGWVFSNINTILALSQFVESTPSGEQAISELENIFRLAAASGYGSARIRFDHSVVRGLEYYTGPVYEIDLQLPTQDDKGKTVRFGSVGGGGRYDGLVSRFRGEPVPATGFSIGVSRLQAALTMLGKLDNKPAPGPVVVTVFDRERVADYQKMVAALRKANIRAELYLGNPKHSVGQQLKYADRRGSPCAIIQGGDEKAKGVVQVKDLIVGAELAKLEKGREEHLKKQAEAQTEVKEEKLVDAVRAVLARHGVSWS